MNALQLVNKLLKDFQVEVRFSQKATADLAGYDSNTQEIIIALIIKRAKGGPLIRPKGLGKPLGKELNGFTRIKPKSLNFRIIYKPVELDNMVQMQVIAIGPRDKNTVYRKAATRIIEFDQEMLDDQ